LDAETTSLPADFSPASEGEVVAKKTADASNYGTRRTAS